MFAFTVILAVTAVSCYFLSILGYAIYVILNIVNFVKINLSVTKFLVSYFSPILNNIVYFIIAIFDSISNIHLLHYYHQYYFTSNSVMRHLRFLRSLSASHYPRSAMRFFKEMQSISNQRLDNKWNIGEDIFILFLDLVLNAEL